MKNILLSIGLIVGFAACHSKSDLDSNYQETPQATVPLYNNSVLSDTAKVITGNQVTKQVQGKRRSASVQHAEEPVVVKSASTRVVETPPLTPVETAPVVTAPVITTPAPVTNDGNVQTAGNVGNASSGPVAAAPQAEKKKGWSNATKGTVIGAGAGAIGGAIISKKKGLGAIVGGVVGAAGGYIIGKGMDKKDNRLTED